MVLSKLQGILRFREQMGKKRIFRARFTSAVAEDPGINHFVTELMAGTISRNRTNQTSLLYNLYFTKSLMWLIIIILIIGGILGYFSRNLNKFNFYSEKTTTVFIYILLFFMGLSVGVNPEIISNLGDLGLSAILITLFSISGSILFSFLFAKRIFKK